MSDFLADASRNAGSRMESMGLPNAPGDPMGGKGKRAMGDVHYRAAGSSTGAGSAPLPGPGGGPMDAGGIGPGAEGNCGSCKSFDGQMACDLVAGNIDPAATCDLFEPAGMDSMMAASAPPAAPPGPVGGDSGPMGA